MSYQVDFTNVGREKHSWTAVVPMATHNHLLLAIRERGALMSDDVSIIFSSDGGVIYAGFHKVGTFTFSPTPENGT